VEGTRVIGVVLGVLVSLLIATALTRALGPAAEERRPEIRPDVLERIDATLPRSQATERWLENQKEMRS